MKYTISNFKLSSTLLITVALFALQPALALEQRHFVAGEDYVLLEQPVVTRDSGKIEVVKAFSYGCPPCYSVERAVAQWQRQQAEDVDFWQFPAVWNEPMKVYARTFYAAQELDVLRRTHMPLFTAIVVEQKKLSTESELAEFFSAFGVESDAFTRAFNSSTVTSQVRQSEARVHYYQTASAPEFVVNGKYRVDRVRAGGLKQMLQVVDYLVSKERDLLAR